MKTLYAVALALLAGCGLGAVAVQGLHAEAKPPAYYISEIVVRDIDPYLKEWSKPRSKPSAASPLPVATRSSRSRATRRSIASHS